MSSFCIKNTIHSFYLLLFIDKHSIKYAFLNKINNIVLVMLIFKHYCFLYKIIYTFVLKTALKITKNFF